MNIERITPKSHAWKSETMASIESYARENFIPVLLEDTANLLVDYLIEYQPKVILEIGTAIGYSGSIILDTLPYAHLTTMELDENSYKVAEGHFSQFGLSGRVTQVLGDAHDVLDDLVAQNKKYDFIFLDGPKGQYIKYLCKLEKLLNCRGILFADNVLYRHMVNGTDWVPHKKRTIVVNLRKYIAEVTTNPTWNTHVYDIGDGVAVSFKTKE